MEYLGLEYDKLIIEGDHRKMSLVYDKSRLQKIKHVFCKHSQGKQSLPHKKIVKFWDDLGINNELFLSDFYYYFPEIEAGADLSFNDCLAFLDYILTPKNSNEEIIQMFKVFDKNGIGHMSTADFLGCLRKEVGQVEFERYSAIIAAYGPSINYFEQFKNKLI